MTLFPVYTPLAVPQGKQKTTITYDTSVKFNFDTGEFVITPTGAVQTISGVETLEEWIRATLATERYMYPIYHQWYGSEAERIIALGLASQQAASEIERMIKEALMVDERVKDVSNFVHTISGDTIQTEFEVLSFDDQIINLEEKTG